MANFSNALPVEDSPPVGGPAPRRLPAGLRQTLSFLAILLLLCALWEGYKLLGAATGNKIPFTAGVAYQLCILSTGPCSDADINLPIRSDDKSMPHIANILGALFRPAQRGNDTILLAILLR